MIKISISGKANSGKDTISKMLYDKISENKQISCKYLAFADPVKKIVRIMFPDLPEIYLTGPSKYRSELVPNAFKDGNPLTVRQLLIDLGTTIGRGYRETIWLDALNYSIQQAEKEKVDMVITSDCRFINEHNFLKKIGFYQIRVLRHNSSNINHSSEIEQDSIANDDFNAIIDNCGTISHLKQEVCKIVSLNNFA